MGDCLDESPSLCYNKGHQVILVALSLLLMAGILKIGTWTATFYARENEMKENMKIRGQLRRKRNGGSEICYFKTAGAFL